MAKTEQSGKPRKRRVEPAQRQAVSQQAQRTPPAQEWGERIATGKAVARGGKTKGAVPGATEQQP